MSKRNSIQRKLSNQDRILNQKLSKKKSNIKLRHGIEFDIGRIDVNMDAKERRRARQQINSFLNPNNTSYQFVKNDNGVSISRREKNEMDRIINRANRLLTAERKRLGEEQFMLDGKPFGKVKDVVVGAKHFTENANIRNPFNFVTSREAFQKSLENRKREFSGNFIKKRQQLYKDNYIKGVYNHHGESYLSNKLVELVKGISNDLFYMASRTVATLELKDVYDPRESDAVLEGLITTWSMEINARKG